MTNRLSRRAFLGATAGVVAAGAARAAPNPCVLPDKWDETRPLVIVGAGGAGMAAAVSAAQNGIKDILVLEKMAFVGGNTLLSGGGFNSYDPKRQKAQGIEDSPQLHAEQMLKGGDYRGNPELVRVMTENSWDTVQWMESLGVRFPDRVVQVYGGLFPRAHLAEDGLGRAYVRVLKENCDKLGVEIRTGSRVTRVVREEPLAGDVLGVEYTDGKGKVHRIRSEKGVIVASGGFGANPEMRAIHDPRLRNLTTTNHVGATGDLIPLVQDIGGEVTGMDYIQCNPGAPPGRKIRAAFHVYPDYCIMIDEKCRRFVAEDERRDIIREAILSLPGQRGFTLIDADGQALYQTDETYVKQTAKCLETGDAWTADTWEELALKMKVDPAALKQCVDEWNALVESTAEDPLGRKRKTMRKLVKAPFWACYAGMSVHYTMGGLLINAKTQVIDREGKIIPKLHAIGEVAGGIHGTNRLGGNSLCDCFTFGRLTGIWVAEGL